jgi:glycosyltransferase involved in cell wall biosynthesis
MAPVKPTPANQCELNADLAKQFAWLLRKDLREAFKTSDNPAYQDWWLVKGRQEYSAWAHEITEAELQALFRSTGKATIADVLVEVPQVVQMLARYRGDALREFTHNGQLEKEKFFAWAMVRGLVEHHLAGCAPRHLIAMLDQSVPDTGDSEHDTPALTLLMYLLWLLMDDPTQQAFDIFKTEGRKAYLSWFFSVVGKLGIAPLIAGRWKSWVKSQAGYKNLQLAWTSADLRTPVPNTFSNKEEKPFGVNLYGFAYGELGIGEDLRMAVACCEATNIPYYVVNVDAGNIRQADNLLKGKTYELQEIKLPPYRNNIFCLPAFDTASRIFMEKGACIFKGYHNIGWWPWELNTFPAAWSRYAFKLVDEVWASSKFLESMYKKATEKNVVLVPIAVSIDRLKKYPRKNFNLSKNFFWYLYIFDFNSYLTRKNPLAVVKSFKCAFPDEKDNVGLVLKTMNVNYDSELWLQLLDYCKNDKRIKIITSTFDRSEVLGLINSCDVYISLHRAEGFGRTLAEAMLLGKQVVATNYSGNIDFCNEDLLVECKLIPVGIDDYQWLDEGDEAFWADVNIENAATMMKKARLNKDLRGFDLSKFSCFKIGEIVKRNLK